MQTYADRWEHSLSIEVLTAKRNYSLVTESWSTSFIETIIYAVVGGISYLFDSAFFKKLVRFD